MALKAGKHVYCEKMMSNTVEAARKMVISQQETGKLCQVGHQRRSNPRYLRLRDEIIGKADGTAKNLTGKSLLGEITHAYAQWNREVKPPLGFPTKFPVPPEVLTM
jgi:predicted dehydrogenase